MLGVPLRVDDAAECGREGMGCDLDIVKEEDKVKMKEGQRLQPEEDTPGS